MPEPDPKRKHSKRFDINSNVMKQFESEAQHVAAASKYWKTALIFLSLPNSEAVESIVDKFLQHDIKVKLL